MKRINKFALFILGALSFASCSDINDIESEGYRITGEQIDDATSHCAYMPDKPRRNICRPTDKKAAMRNQNRRIALKSPNHHILLA